MVLGLWSALTKSEHYNTHPPPSHNYDKCTCTWSKSWKLSKNFQFLLSSNLNADGDALKSWWCKSDDVLADRVVSTAVSSSVSLSCSSTLFYKSIYQWLMLWNPITKIWSNACVLQISYSITNFYIIIIFKSNKYFDHIFASSLTCQLINSGGSTFQTANQILRWLEKRL